MPPKRQLEIGKRFGRLVVIAEASDLAYSKCKPTRQYLCKCDCGNQKIIRRDSLVSGRTQSCGCLQSDNMKNSPHRLRHDMSHTVEHNAWLGMKGRCCNKNHKSYQHYGGRGIVVCQRWLESFENFYHDMGPRPKNHTLGRIDTNGNYDPNNVRWESQKTQQNNRRNNTLITYDSKTLNIMQWSNLTGLPYRVLRWRILYKKWPIKRALTEPMRKIAKRNK